MASEQAETLAIDADANGWPEHAKLHRLDGENEVIGRFLEWLDAEGISLCRMTDFGEYWPIYQSIQRTIGQFYGIDYDALQREKSDMLERIRADYEERRKP